MRLFSFFLPAPSDAIRVPEEDLRGILQLARRASRLARMRGEHANAVEALDRIGDAVADILCPTLVLPAHD